MPTERYHLWSAATSKASLAANGRRRISFWANRLRRYHDVAVGGTVACSGHDVWLAIKQLWVRLPVGALSSSNPGQVVHTHVTLAKQYFDTGHAVVTFCRWKDNRKLDLASHSSCVTDSVVYPPIWAQCFLSGKWAPHLHSRGSASFRFSA